VYPPAKNIAVDVCPNFFNARDTFTPPPPGSNFGGEHLNFFSGTNAAIVVLLSIAGFNVIVRIFSIGCELKMQKYFFCYQLLNH
jgi:hypothetical protein